MVTFLKIQTQPTYFLTKPTSNRLSLVSCSNLEFQIKQGIEQSKLLVLNLKEEKMESFRKLSRGCFGNPPEKDHKVKTKVQKVEIESRHGGEDIFSAGEKVKPEHLVIMVNGIVGSAADWEYAAEQFVKTLPGKVIVHRSEKNYAKLTFEGVDLMGERLAGEVLEVVERWPDLRKISFVAHSLGGLVARYAIGRLYDIPEMEIPVITNNCVHIEHLNGSRKLLNESLKARVATLEPMNFITFATPHLGSRGHRQIPLLCGLEFLEKRASETAHIIAGRSGKHLFLNDNDEGKPPLLIRMVNDSDELKFMSALRSFKRRVAYSNVNHDFVVGWRTSSIRRQCELPPSNQRIKDKTYPHIVHFEHETSIKGEPSSKVVKKNFDLELEEEMIKGLTQVPWERVDVSFHGSKQRYIAHNTILVKSYRLNSDGADVVRHMIDNFMV